MIGLEALPDGLQAELLQTAEGGQVRTGEGSVRHVEVFPMDSVRTPITVATTTRHQEALQVIQATLMTALSRTLSSR